jgi:hypothetical protein
VRGIVASKLGRPYTGIDLRAEQIDANRTQAEQICDEPMPRWVCGDSRDNQEPPAKLVVRRARADKFESASSAAKPSPVQGVASCQLEKPDRYWSAPPGCEKATDFNHGNRLCQEV